MAILAIARNTFRETVRDKILYNLILFALIMIISSIALGQLTLGHDVKVITDLGLSSISIFGTVIAVFIGIGLVYKEIERRTIYFLLSKPVRRQDLVIGKFLGLAFTLLVNVGVMTVGLMTTVLIQGSGLSACVALLPSIYLIFLSLMLTTAVALLFSTFSTPALSALFTFFVWVIGHFNRDLYDFGQFTHSAALNWIGKSLYYIIPNFGNFAVIEGRNVIQNAAYSVAVNGAAIAWVTAYGVLYCTFLVALAVVVFSRREFA